MGKTQQDAIRLAFSDKYDREHAWAYLEKHRDGLARRLSHWREERLARRALRIAGDPTLVLDLPCGAGRFWPLLAEQPSRVIIGADSSTAMLQVASNAQPTAVVQRIRTLRTSAFDIALPDRAVDCIFSMRLLHHIGEAEHRVAMLREYRRVTRDIVIVSLWVDGNYMAWKRRRLERRRAGSRSRRYQNRFVLPARQVEAEFRQSGFDVLAHLDFMPLYAMWRVYVLRRSGLTETITAGRTAP